MSSILRALKKLDEDAATKESQTQPGEPVIKLRHAVNRQGVSSGRWIRLLSIAAIFLSVGVIVWLFTGYHLSLNSEKGNPTPTPQVNNQKQTAPQNPPDKITTNQMPANQPPTNPPPSNTTAPNTTNQNTTNQNTIMLSSNTPNPRTVKTENAPLQNNITKSPPSVNHRRNRATKPPVKRQFTRTSPDKASHPNLKNNTSPPGPRPKLVLSGIIWSPTPGRRRALINDRYLKEGDEVQGVIISQIDKKSVTLRKEGDKWTIRM